MTLGWRETAIISLVTGLATFAGPATLAQAPYPAPAAPPPANPVCTRLEAQLATIDRGTVDPARAEQIRRLEDVRNKQQADVDRMSAQASRMGCQGGGFFSLFTGQNPQCTPLNQQLQQARANLEKVLADLDRLQGGGEGAREAQRATVINALAQNNCGPQYSAAANQQRGFLDNLFGSRPGNNGTYSSNGPYSSIPSGTYRTVCVRMCDGYYFPISYATTADHFAEDAQTCQETCPAAQVVLMSNPTGSDINQAVASNGAPYTSLPNAFKYRTALVPACGCRKPGESWAQALGGLRDNTLQQDDIVVTPDKAKTLSAPRDAQGRLIRDVRTLDSQDAGTAAAASIASASSNEGDTVAPSSKKKPVRAVGPTFVPPR
ncbi:MAG TPA: DUF2865 domain-containing protein [Xanthobacteraceae bacterium]|nr:DUF2865 domain-containing protein [Xanthobacteraceae bacterium]